MNKDKQIEEMAKVIDERDRYKRYYFNHEYDKMEADIRAEVAREIFEEIDKITMHNVTSSHGIWLMSMSEVAFADLKKKYTQEK